jgi:hypothetical protein
VKQGGIQICVIGEICGSKTFLRKLKEKPQTDKITGALSSFDRVLFNGYLTLRDGKSMESSMVGFSGCNE